MNPATYSILTQRIKQLGHLPAMPAILATLCDALGQKTQQINVDEVVRQILYDQSLAAQCLRVANSALFRQRGDVTTVKDAVLALGLWRIRDLAFSCSLPMLFANVNTSVGKEVFWRHALGTAVISEGLGRELGARFLEGIYLAGLLHDIGVLVNAVLFMDDFRDVLKESMENRLPLDKMEQRILGFTHGESGRILAELWRLPTEFADVIEYHEDPEKLNQKPDGAQNTALSEMVVLVHAADLICQKMGLGYGYELKSPEVNTLPGIWQTLEERFPIARSFTESTSTKLAHHLVSEAEKLADTVFTPVMTTS